MPPSAEVASVLWQFVDKCHQLKFCGNFFDPSCVSIRLGCTTILVECILVQAHGTRRIVSIGHDGRKREFFREFCIRRQPRDGKFQELPNQRSRREANSVTDHRERKQLGRLAMDLRRS